MADDSVNTANPGTPPFADLVRRELRLTGDEADAARGERWLEQPPRSLFGLSLSGGGIRSATFNLGLLQGLHEIGLLRGMDYLSTVSGGGYVGGFWTRWRSNPHIPKPPRGEKIFPDATLIGAADHPANRARRLGEEPAEISHLRRFSRFLAPNLGVFTFDTGRMLVAVVNAAVPSLVGSATFLFSALLASIGIAWLVLLPPQVLPSLAGTLFSVNLRSALGMFVFGAVHLAVMHLAWHTVALTARRVLLVIVILLVLALTWGLMVGLPWPASVGPTEALDWFGRVGNGEVPSFDDPIWGYLAAPALALALVSVLNALVRPRREEDPDRPMAIARAEADRVSSWLMFAGAAWIAIVLLWWIAFFIAGNEGALGPAIRNLTVGGIPLAGLVSWLSRFTQSQTPSGEGTARRAGRLSLVTVGYIALAALVVAAMLAVIAVHRTDRWLLLGALWLAGGLYTIALYDPNRIGLHEFYRARIVRGFLGAGNVTGQAATDDSSLPQKDDDEAMNALTGDRPLHLVSCAANDLTPREPLKSLSRGAVSAVVSPVGYSVGESWATWNGGAKRPSMQHIPTLGAVVTASGAAFNTQMGSQSKALGPAVTYLLTSLGLRLGLWLRHPKAFAEKTSSDTSSAPISVVRKGRGFAFFAELFGLSDATNGRWVFLSDGGHFDNTGLYELIRRHCRFIIASDCGQDTDRAFDDLGNVVRRAREDFDVDIRINLEPLKPDANGMSRQPMVAGDIHYPDGDTGTLLVFKPSIVGTEPPDVLQYKARNPIFPHQSTGDQFFDEAQWESYRRLGQHAARIAFASSTEAERHASLASTPRRLADFGTSDKEVEQLADAMSYLFASARREWFARPDDYTERVERLERQVAGLDQLLTSETPRLLREVMWELWNSPKAPERDAPDTAAQNPLDEWARSISAIRQAMVTFEAMFHAENLATQFNQPMYAGVMNVMARWMRAPLVRAWWPLLKATCTRSFRKFAEAQFDLATARGALAAVTAIDRQQVLDVASWNRGQSGLGDGPVQLHLTMTLEDLAGVPGTTARPAVPVEVARLDANAADGAASGRRLLLWLARDLVVPPGLWGTGLGSELLKRMGEHATDRDVARVQLTVNGKAETAECDWYGQVVFVRIFRSAGANAKKDSADLQRLYVSADFEPVQVDDMVRRYGPGFLDTYDALQKRWAELEPLLPKRDELARSGAENYVLLHRPEREQRRTPAVASG